MTENGDQEPGADHATDETAGCHDATPPDRTGPEPGGDDAMLLALATGATINEAAERAGCSARTVSRRLADRQFARQVSTLRGQLFAVAVGRLCNNAALAADKLVSLLGSEQDHVAYAAAKSILELGTKLREAGELEERLAALEGKADVKADDSETTVVYPGGWYDDATN